MDTSWSFWVLLALCAIGWSLSLALTAILLWLSLSVWPRRLSMTSDRLSARNSKTLSESLKTNSALLDKAMSLLSTRDPMVFQALQAMSNPPISSDFEYDPGDEAEIERLRALGREQAEDDLSGDELYALAEVFAVGADELQRLQPDG